MSLGPPKTKRHGRDRTRIHPGVWRADCISPGLAAGRVVGAGANGAVGEAEVALTGREVEANTAMGGGAWKGHEAASRGAGTNATMQRGQSVAGMRHIPICLT